MAHLWSGRFEGDPDKDLIDFGASFRFDRRLFADDVTGSIAWAEGLEKAGVLSEADGASIRAGLEEILAHGDNPSFFGSPEIAKFTIMLLDAFGVHVPHWVSPVITFVAIGYFFLKSVREIRRKEKAEQQTPTSLA